MPWVFLLAVAAGFVAGRVFGRSRGGSTEAETFEEGGADEAARAAAAERG